MLRTTYDGVPAASIQYRHNWCTGSFVAVLDFTDSPNTQKVYGGPYALYCHEHRRHEARTNKAKAKRELVAPQSWCAACQAEANKGALAGGHAPRIISETDLHLLSLETARAIAKKLHTQGVGKTLPAPEYQKIVEATTRHIVDIVARALPISRR